MTVTAEQTIHVPQHPGTAVSIDETGTSFLIVSYGEGENAAIARTWLSEAAAFGPVQWLTFPDFNADTARHLSRTLSSALTGLRVTVVGTRFDVLQTFALLRGKGALEGEVRGQVSDNGDLPLYCAHCRATSRVMASPGDLVECPACARTLEVHPHVSAARGSYLGSDAYARTLA